MISIFSNTPKAKDNSLCQRIFLLILSFICCIFIFSPVFAFAAKGSSPLTEMPDNPMYYVLKGFFGVALIIGSALYLFTKNNLMLSASCTLGFITSLFPLIANINKLTEYKTFVEQFSMTAEYTSYWVNIGIHLLFSLLCLIAALHTLGLIPYNIIIYVIASITITAVIFITIDRAKNIEHGIFNIYDICCFAYTSIAALLPCLFALSVQQTKRNKKDKYSPQRMIV